MSRIISLDIGEVEYPDPNVFKTCPKISSTGACPKCVENISVKSKEHLQVKGGNTIILMQNFSKNVQYLPQKIVLVVIVQMSHINGPKMFQQLLKSLSIF